MSKVAKLFRAIQLIVRQPSLLNLVLESNEVMKEQVTRMHNFQHGFPTVSVTSLLPMQRITIQPVSFSDGGSTPMDLALLKGLASQFQSCTYFEIGTWRGESAAIVASVAQHCYTLNLTNDELLQLGKSEAYINAHGFFSKSAKNIEHLHGNSRSFDFSPYYGKCDLVFVDGDHHYESVKHDTSEAFKLLKNEHSIIVWHDYGNSPTTIRWEVIAGILDGCPATKRNQLYRVSNTLCAIFTNRKLENSFPSDYENPTRFFEVGIESRAI